MIDNSIKGKMKCNLLLLFSIAVFASLFILAVLAVITNGAVWSTVFFSDTRDTGMDFFNSVAETRGDVPYTQFGSIYPPLATLIYLLVQKTVPEDISVLWPDTHLEVVAMRGTGLDLRSFQSPMLFFLLGTIACVMLLAVLVEYLLQGKKYAKTTAFASAFSYGALYAIERGNIILLSFVFTLMFFAFQKSRNKALQELSLVCLALAAAIKIYPAIFGLLLLKRKKYGQAVRAIIYGFLLFVLPFFFFEGAAAIKAFFLNLFSFGGQPAWGAKEFGLHGIMEYILYLLSCFRLAVPGNLSKGTEYAILICLAVLLLYSFFACQRESVECLALTLLLILIQKSLGYTLIFFLIPLIQLLRKSDVLEPSNELEFICLLLIMTPYPNVILYEGYSLHTILTVFSVCGLFIWTVYTTVREAHINRMGKIVGTSKHSSDPMKDSNSF